MLWFCEFDYKLDKPRKANVVVDALSHKVELAPPVDSMLESNFLDHIKQGMKQDALAKNLLKLAKEGKTRRFWENDGTILILGNSLFVPRWGNLRRAILKEFHDSMGLVTGMNRMLALVQDKYYWLHMQDDVEAYVKTCLVCQQAKVEQQYPTSVVTEFDKKVEEILTDRKIKSERSS